MSKNLLSALTVALWLLGLSSAYADHIDSMCNLKQCNIGQRVWIEGGNKNDAYFACETSQLSDYTNGILGIVGMQIMLGVHPEISQKTGEPVFQDETEDLITIWRKRAGVDSFYQAEQHCEHIVTHGRKVAATIVSIPSIHRKDMLYDNAALVQVSGKHGERYWLPYGYLNAVR